MTKVERLRRVVLVCGYFARNLAYYRAAWRENESGKKVLRGACHDFWRHTNSNFLDVAVLEWCKLFGDKNDPHHWSQIVSSPGTFEQGLLHHLGMDGDAFKNYIGTIRRYRDKFVAHLDSESVMNIPDFDKGNAAVDFYHAHIVMSEIQGPHELEGLVTSLAGCYREAMEAAERIYDVNHL
jgi:hypothetical protein